MKLKLIKRPRTRLQREVFAKARMVSETGGQKKAFTYTQVMRIKAALFRRGELRDLALFCTGIDTMLRSCDLLKLRVEDVKDTSTGRMKHRMSIRQMKTDNTVLVMLSGPTRDALQSWIEQTGKTSEDFLWTDHRGRHPWFPLTRGAYAHLVKDWCRLIGIKDLRNYSTHSLRRTRAVFIFKKTKDYEVVRNLLGHQGLTATHEYLGISKDQALKVAKRFLM